MKKLLILAVMALSGLSAFAYDAEIDGIYYNFSEDEAIVTYQDNNYNSYSGNIVIPESVTYNGKDYVVTSIGTYAFFGCSGLISVAVPNSITSFGNSAFRESSLTSIIFPSHLMRIDNAVFDECKLRNILIKCTTPPIIYNYSFSVQTYYHTTLYVPTDCWDAYAYDDAWYRFINIRETAMTEEEVSEQQAYTLMDVGTFSYSVYDPVNDCIGTVNSVGGINEDNPNHSWQMIEADGAHYLYNIGAKKYVKRNGNGLDLTDTPEPIEVADSDKGIVLGAQTNKQWAFVGNERMSVAQSAIDEVTGIRNLTPALPQREGDIYDLSGRQMVNGTPQLQSRLGSRESEKSSNGKLEKGIYIMDGRKVLIK